MHPFAISSLDRLDDISERIASTIQRDRIPTPPAKFRALVNGGPIDAEHHARIGQHFLVLLREHCGLKSSSVVLDIGCGCGRIATPLAKYLSEGTYHGVDIMESMIDWCKTNISTRVPNFHFHHADLSNSLYRSEGRTSDSYVFPFPDEMFDIIFATSVFTHLVPASANQYAREIARLLKTGTGRAFLTFYLTNDGVRQRRDTLPFSFHQCDGYGVVDRANPEVECCVRGSRCRYHSAERIAVSRKTITGAMEQESGLDLSGCILGFQIGSRNTAGAEEWQQIARAERRDSDSAGGIPDVAERGTERRRKGAVGAVALSAI